MLRWPIPRLVAVLPLGRGRKPLTELERSFDEWSAKLQEWCLGGKKDGKRFATRELRIFFLCPYNMSLAECGPTGQGYEVSSPRKGRLNIECSFLGAFP